MPESKPETSERPQVGIVLHLFGRFMMWLLGWRAEGQIPSERKLVLIAHPHTTNWDMIFMMGVSWSLRLKINWIGKRAIFRWPYGWLMRACGGVMVDRSQGKNQVQQMADTITSNDDIFLAVAPSGSRSKREHWRSGFYYIALTAKVPVLCCYLDYPNKVGGIGPCVYLTGDTAADMDKFREFYASKQGKYPQKSTPVRLKDELDQKD